MSGDFNELDDEQSSEELSYILSNVFVYDKEGNIKDVDTQKVSNVTDMSQKRFKK